MTEERKEEQTEVLGTNPLPHTPSKLLSYTKPLTLLLSVISCWVWTVLLGLGLLSNLFSFSFALPQPKKPDFLPFQTLPNISRPSPPLPSSYLSFFILFLDLPHSCLWIPTSGSSVSTLCSHHCCWRDLLQSLIQDFSSSCMKRPIQALRGPCTTSQHNLLFLRHKNWGICATGLEYRTLFDSVLRRAK